ncbi:MAG: AIR synthase-related protein, partial [Chloroflexota bacterium]
QTPIMDGVWDLIAKGTIPGGTIRNLKSLANIVRWDEKVSQDGRIVLADAQTSGGLLMATPPDKVDRLLKALRQAGVQGAIIGEFTQDRGPAMVVVP